MRFVPIRDQIPERKTRTAADRETATAIHGELIGDDRAVALGIQAQSSAPVLALCRALVAAGHDPASPLRVRSIGEAADLQVNSKGTGFVRRASRIDWAAPTRPPLPDAGDPLGPTLRTAARAR
jgi:hypothetical protein